MSHANVIVALDGSLDTEDIDAIISAVAHQMDPFDENGEWFRHGSRWDWWRIGGRFDGSLCGKNIIRRGELTEDGLSLFQEERANRLWDEFEAEPDKRDFVRVLRYGLSEDDTRCSTIKKFKQRKLWAFAFLKDRKWIEQGRLGWFGATTATECELSTDGEWKERCIHRCEKTGAVVADFVGPNDCDDQWKAMYWPRFIRPLPSDTILVVVDYHV